MLKKISLLTIVLAGFNSAHATILEEFLAYQEMLQAKNVLYEIDNRFEATSKQRTVSLDAKVFLKKDAQASYIVQNGRPTIFLTTPLGAWVIQENIPNPLKVSGGYTVFGIMTIDDVLGLDYWNDYTVISNTADTVTLQSKEKSAAYNFIKITKKSSTNFETILMDRNQTPIKSGKLTLGTVNNIKTIVYAEFTDLVFAGRTSSFKVTNLKKSKIPIQILVPERIKLLFNQVK